ncbi:MAG: phosphate acyltransferase PlsX [Planctomycetes bacterium]|nr:phosphate acyltransferase PlsX [Planctomycetota bacterium]
MSVAIDAMGGDNAPHDVIEGTLSAAEELKEQSFILVGDRVKIEGSLMGRELPSNVRIHHASQVVGMDESIAMTVKEKPDSSIKVACDLVRAGEASSVMSAGHTGAATVCATLLLKTLPGIKRPGIAAVMPSLTGHVVFIDVGANIEPKPLHLYHYGLMGSMLARKILNKSEPTIGLLTIGEEDSKGTGLVKETHALFKKSALKFHGNVEGSDLFKGTTDVVVCDGFSGNLVLKTAEGLAKVIMKIILDAISAENMDSEAMSQLFPMMMKVKKRLDYKEYGGALLLGVRGNVVIAHGKSDSKTIANAIRFTETMRKAGVNEGICEGLEDLGS